MRGLMTGLKVPQTSTSDTATETSKRSILRSGGRSNLQAPRTSTLAALAAAPAEQAKPTAGETEIDPEDENAFEQHLVAVWQNLMMTGRDPLASMEAVPCSWPRTSKGFALTRLNTGVAMLHSPDHGAGSGHNRWLQEEEVEALTGRQPATQAGAIFQEYGSYIFHPIRETDGTLALDTNGYPRMSREDSDTPSSRIVPHWSASQLQMNTLPSIAQNVLSTPALPCPAEDIPELSSEEAEYISLCMSLEEVFIPFLARRVRLSVPRLQEHLQKEYQQDGVVISPVLEGYTPPPDDAVARSLFVTLPESIEIGACLMAAAEWVIHITHPILHEAARKKASQDGREFSERGYFGRMSPNPSVKVPLQRMVAILLGVLFTGRIPALPLDMDNYANFQERVLTSENPGFVVKQVLSMGPAYIQHFGASLMSRDLADPRDLFSGESPFGTPGPTTSEIRSLLGID